MRAAFGLICAVWLALAAAPAAAQSGVNAAFLTRMDTLEAEIRRLTARVEQLERELAEHKADAEARRQEFDYRLITLEGGDPTQAFVEPDAAPAPAPSPAEPTPPEQAAAPAPDGPGAPPAALGELTAPASPDFAAAMRDLETLGPDAGARSVAAFIEAAPADPNAGEAYRALGRAYLDNGRAAEAARSFVTGLRDYGGQPSAPETMLGLGEALTALGRKDDACGAFRELPRRYPGASRATLDAAATGAFRAGCS